MKVDKTKQKICRLEDICVVRTGRKDANHASDNGEYPFFTCGTNPLKSTTYSFDGENLIIPGNGDIGRCFYYNGKIEAYQRTYVLHLKENSNIDIKYLYLVFKAGWKLFVKNKILGAAMPYIKLGHLNSFPITIYELGVQKAIATELDSIQTMIDGYKAQLANLDALAQSIFLDMFGDVAINNKSWDIIPMGQLGDFKNGLNYNKGEKGKTLKIIGVGDFQNLKAITLFDNIPSIEVESISQEYLLQNEDIVFVRSNGNKNLVGRCLEVYPYKEEVTFSGFCIRFRKSIDIVNKYLVALLTDTGFKKTHILKSNGIGIQNINQKLLSNLPIPVPPIDLQKRFAMHVKTIERQKELIRQQLADAEQLMAERMQYYFS